MLYHLFVPSPFGHAQPHGAALWPLTHSVYYKLLLSVPSTATYGTASEANMPYTSRLANCGMPSVQT